MAYKEHNVTEILDILRRAQAGDGKRRIAKATGIDRNTIRKYLKLAEAVRELKAERVLALTATPTPSVVEACGFTPLSDAETLHEIALAVFRDVHLAGEEHAGRWFSGCFPLFRLADVIRYEHTKLLRRRELVSVFQLVLDNCLALIKVRNCRLNRQ